MATRSFFALSILGPFAWALVASGCAEPPAKAPTATDAPAAPSATQTPVSSAAASVPSAKGEGTSIPRCGLETPVVSADTCSVDADCAPATACHATACVGKAKAEPQSAKTMCTKDFRCNSVDANACGCVQGKCTLHFVERAAK